MMTIRARVAPRDDAVLHPGERQRRYVAGRPHFVHLRPGHGAPESDGRVSMGVASQRPFVLNASRITAPAARSASAFPVRVLHRRAADRPRQASRAARRRESSSAVRGSAVGRRISTCLTGRPGTARQVRTVSPVAAASVAPSALNTTAVAGEGSGRRRGSASPSRFHTFRIASLLSVAGTASRASPGAKANCSQLCTPGSLRKVAPSSMSRKARRSWRRLAPSSPTSGLWD